MMIGRSAVRGLLVAGIVLTPAAVRAVDVTDILTRMRAAVEPGRDMQAQFDLIMTNKDGEHTQWSGRFYRLCGPAARERILLEVPADLRGVSLSVERGANGRDRMRTYLPTIRRIREIEQDMRGEAFLGTDFNFEDLGFEQLDYAKNALIGDGKVDGRPCRRVESTPDRSWWYGRIVRCIDTEDYLPRRTEYFDLAGELYKVRTFDRVERIGKHPTPVTITMSVPRSGTSTRLVLRDVQYDTGIAPGTFDVQ